MSEKTKLDVIYSLYAAFDLYPSAKGAATHISHMSETLFDTFGSGMLYVLGNHKMPDFQIEGNVVIKRFVSEEPNFLQRAEAYSQALFEQIERLDSLKLVHFRDIWSGLAILKKERNYKTVYEVNSLASIELPYRYAGIEDELLDKIRIMEEFCLTKADKIITPSENTRKLLLEKGIETSKIQVISNGADIPEKYEKPIDAPEKYLIYFGALQTWQGVDILLKSMHLLRDYSDLKLVICSSNRPRFSKNYRKLAEKLEINDQIIWYHQLPKNELYAWIQHALLSIAPLSETERNIVQGASPLKIFESMACQTAVVASDLPIVREIVEHLKTAYFVRPDRPAELARGMRFLLDQPNLRTAIQLEALQHLEKKYSWKQKKKELKNLYEKMTTFEF